MAHVAVVYLLLTRLVVNRDILAIAEEHKDKTVEKVLGKSDAEIGLDFLMGKLKLQAIKIEGRED